MAPHQRSIRSAAIAANASANVVDIGRLYVADSVADLLDHLCADIDRVSNGRAALSLLDANGA